jgi:hypothetical protein
MDIANRKITAIVAFMLLAATARAQEAGAPLVLAIPSHGDYQPHGGYLGIVGAIITDLWFNSRIAKDIKDFQQSAGATKWDELAAGEFSCVGIPPGQKCRDVLRFDGNEEELNAKLRASGATHAIVIGFFQQFNGLHYRARATLREVELLGKGTQVHRTLTAIYNSDAPEAVNEAAKGSSAKLRDYWMTGTTSILEQEGLTSLTRLRDMLNTLLATVGDDGNTSDGWKNLKPISELEALGRAHCHGLPCFRTRVFADQADHIWLASEDYPVTTVGR